MQFAVRRDEVLAAIGHQKALKRDGGIDPVGGQLIAIGVNVARALRPQFVLHRHEEIEECVPGIRNIRNLETCLLDQRIPNMKRDPSCLHWHAVECALLGRVVVAVGGAQRRVDVLRFLGLDDVADVDELVGPCVQRQKGEIGVFHDVRDDAAGYGRDFLLAQRRERNDAVLDLIAAGFLVVGHQLFEGDILFLSETLGPPDLCGRRRRVGDMRPRQSTGGGKPERAAQHRAPGKDRHTRLPSPFLAADPKRTRLGCCLPRPL